MASRMALEQKHGRVDQKFLVVVLPKKGETMIPLTCPECHCTNGAHYDGCKLQYDPTATQIRHADRAIERLTVAANLANNVIQAWMDRSLSAERKLQKLRAFCQEIMDKGIDPKCLVTDDGCHDPACCYEGQMRALLKETE